MSISSALYTPEFQNLKESLFRRKSLPFADLVERVRDELDLEIMVSLRDREKIPAEGRLLIAANHPLAFLDLIAVYSTVHGIRRDITVVADSLSEFTGDDGTVVVNSGKQQPYATLKKIQKALNEERAVIYFPAKTRHWRLRQISDGDWSKAVAQMATLWQVPVVAMHIAARNRLSHYFWTAVSGLYSDISLDSEIKSQKHSSIALTVSHPILPEAFAGIKAGAAAKLLRRHVYQIGRGKPGTFRTTKNIVHPTDKKQILNDIMQAEVLGETEDKISILLVRYETAPALMREIGRLRELTFRKVGEGTLRKIDLDEFDEHYLHIVLWDAAELEVVGAYRLAAGDEIYRQRGTSGFYTSTLFRFNEEFEKYLPQSLELGRSFVQPAYWNSQALDYLWHGIGAFMAKNPQYNYLFGPVSVSASYSVEAREMLVWFYSRWFGKTDGPVRAKHRFAYRAGHLQQIEKAFKAEDYKQSFKELKQNLKHYGYSVPTLYKQYTELCDEGGVSFFDFGIDKDFNNSLDGFIFLDISKIKEAKLERYVYSKRAKEEWTADRERVASLTV
ncbi:GNAT family N-acyltransferase [Turneriella parva]|uniref:Phospholipid/glycerol acyltransferase n=1 Tax=Turneriella parva (strain ATCC BAA-1111 / DSM 21527 / NCTC 11395 / H) TaxID=869212 RepID=I4BAL8_TURPD|nr:lysophospholipid acyltransferase family protein [Turneriella parva]AFM14325.1 phospholipid/glycerol acyltransferase [Turneriella parva DSM 21527]